MKLIHKPIAMIVKNENGNHYLVANNEPEICDIKARSRNYKNCYVVKVGWNVYSFDSDYEYDLVISKGGIGYIIEFIKKD